jgi:hypothetical protein
MQLGQASKVLCPTQTTLLLGLGSEISCVSVFSWSDTCGYYIIGHKLSLLFRILHPIPDMNKRCGDYHLGIIVFACDYF